MPSRNVAFCGSSGITRSKSAYSRSSSGTSTSPMSPDRLQVIVCPRYPLNGGVVPRVTVRSSSSTLVRAIQTLGGDSAVAVSTNPAVNRVPGGARSPGSVLITIRRRGPNAASATRVSPGGRSGPDPSSPPDPSPGTP